MATGVLLRAARVEDLAAVCAINGHYVLNTVLTFVEEPKPLEEFESTYHSISSRGLPYIAAASAESPAEVLGYAYAQGFRDGKGAYRHTVEVTLFCHPDHRGKGIGSMLLTELLSALRAPEEHSRYRSGGADVAPRSVRQVLAVMAVDDEGPRNGLALKEFYEGFGFKLNGHLKSVGYKLGRWVDTMYLQLSF